MGTDNDQFGHPCCINHYPDVGSIVARCFENLDSEKECRNAFSYKLIGRKKKMNIQLIKKAIECVNEDLKKDIERYENILKNGDGAMSRYDLKMGYTAQTSGLPLKYNHIGYQLGRLRILKHWLKKLAPVKKLRQVKINQQLELF